MKVKPILFSDDMVRALLDGRKTQTRRIVKPQPPETHEWRGWVIDSLDRKAQGCASWAINGSKPLSHNAVYAKPRCKADDLIYVRETFYQRGRYVMPMWPEAEPEDAVFSGEREVRFIGDDLPDNGRYFGEKFWRKRPSIHMPRWASRLTLKVTSVRVERLQDISADDAKAEGVFIEPHEWRDPEYCLPDVAFKSNPDSDKRTSCPKRAFGWLWESINGKDSWSSNPWVWVIEFEAIKANIDDVLKQAEVS